MTLTVIAARLRKVAASMGLLVAKGADLDFPDELVPPLTVNALRMSRRWSRWEGMAGKRTRTRAVELTAICLNISAIIGLGGSVLVGSQTLRWHREGLHFSLST
jgi:hypothetical protein